MAVLSVKVSMDLAEAFQAYAKDNGTTTSALLRDFVETVVHWRRFEVFDPEVAEPAGWLFVDPDWDLSGQDAVAPAVVDGRRKLGLPRTEFTRER